MSTPLSIVEEYAQQYRLRDWAAAYALLPIASGQTVLDLGCGLGDQARDLARRASQVIAIDGSPELLAQARSIATPNITYHQAELSALAGLALPPADGLWCSFTAAYFPKLGSRLRAWSRLLKPGAWLALVEADDIFGHTPMAATDRALIDRYYTEARAAGLYDFQLGHKLVEHVTQAGLEPVLARTLADREFGFQGPASADALAAWERRLSRLRGLQSLCGDEFPAFRQRFLATLSHPEHQSQATVHFVLCRLPASG